MRRLTATDFSNRRLASADLRTLLDDMRLHDAVQFCDTLSKERLGTSETNPVISFTLTSSLAPRPYTRWHNALMHEMALAENIVGIVDQAARRAGLARVHRVNVRIGELAVVIPDALQAAFVGATAGTLADGATLKIEFESGVAWCKNCVASVTMHDALDACPTCGGYQLTVTGGNSLRVIDIEGDDEPCAPPAAAAPTPSN